MRSLAQTARTVQCPKCKGKGTLPAPEVLANELRDLRAKAGLSLRELGTAISKSSAFLSDIEHARRAPSPKTLTDWIAACRQKVVE